MSRSSITWRCCVGELGDGGVDHGARLRVEHGAPGLERRAQCPSGDEAVGVDRLRLVVGRRERGEAACSAPRVTARVRAMLATIR